MRARILLSALLLALVALGPARAATFSVSIASSGFSPGALTIAVGDAVTWTNNDSTSHQIESTDARFTSPLLKPGESWSFVFRTQGRFTYRDADKRRERGTVTVQGPASQLSLTAAASATTVVYGGTVTLSGTVSTKGSGETVTVYAKRFDQQQFAAVGSAITSQNGSWSFLVRPAMQTAYEARWKPSTTTAASSPVAVRVRPQVGLRVKAAAGRVVTFFTKVRGARTFAGRFLYFQRKNRFGQWVTLKKVTLGPTSSATFKSRLPSGRSRVRTFMPPAQAAPGYLAGFSRVLTLSR
jgi:plastocyanin